MSTWNAKAEEVNKQWWIVDATDKRLGRLATELANVLRGKNKPIYTPHVDTGDFVVVINADKIQVTGNKLREKKYYRHSRFFGSLKEKSAAEKMEEDSAFLIEQAVWGMLPQTKLSTQILTKLKVYPGAEHPHSAQRPQALTIKN